MWIFCCDKNAIWHLRMLLSGSGSVSTHAAKRWEAECQQQHSQQTTTKEAIDGGPRIQAYQRDLHASQSSQSSRYHDLDTIAGMTVGAAISMPPHTTEQTPLQGAPWSRDRLQDC